MTVGRQAYGGVAIREGVGDGEHAWIVESAIGGLLLVSHVEGDNHANDIVV